MIHIDYYRKSTLLNFNVVFLFRFNLPISGVLSSSMGKRVSNLHIFWRFLNVCLANFPGYPYGQDSSCTISKNQFVESHGPLKGFQCSCHE